MKIFLDDERFPIGDDWTICRSEEDVLNILLVSSFMSGENDLQICEMSFDHDLGKDAPNGAQVAKSLIDIDAEVRDSDTAGLFADDARIYVHSMNPVGAKNIADRFFSYFKHIGISDTAKVYIHGMLYKGP